MLYEKELYRLQKILYLTSTLIYINLLLKKLINLFPFTFNRLAGAVFKNKFSLLSRELRKNQLFSDGTSEYYSYYKDRIRMPCMHREGCLTRRLINHALVVSNSTTLLTQFFNKMNLSFTLTFRNNPQHF